MKYLLFLLIISVLSVQSTVKTWTTIYGAKFGSGGFGIACDSKNNMYAAGRTMGAFDKQKHTGYTDDACLSKFAPNGKRRWTKIWGTQDQDGCYGITVDKDDNIIVVGYLSGSIDGQPFLGEKDLFAAKYNSDGKRIWLKIWGTESYDYAKNVTSDDKGNIYVVGTTMGEFPGYVNTSWNDVCVSKLNSSGELLWVRQFGSSASDFGESIAVNNNNEILVCGGTRGPLDGQPGVGDMDLFLKCYSTNGVTKWAKLWGSYDFDVAYDIAFDTNNNIYIAGWANGPVDGQPYIGKGDFCLTKFNYEGTQLWVKLWGSSEADWCSGIVLHENKLYISGVTDGDVDGQKSIGRYDLYFAEVNTNGEIQSSKLWGSDKNDYSGKICSDNLGMFYIIGETFGSFGGQKNKAIEDAPNIFVSAFEASTNLNITSSKGKIGKNKFKASFFHISPVEYYFNGSVTVTVNNVTNVFSSDDAVWKWNKKGTVGKIKRNDKSIFKIKGVNPQKRKIMVKLYDNNFTNGISDLNINVNFSNGQKGNISVQPDSKGKF